MLLAVHGVEVSCLEGPGFTGSVNKKDKLPQLIKKWVPERGDQD